MPGTDRPPHPVRIRFAERLKAARLAQKLSQRELHERSGIAISFISGVENGTRSLTLDTAAQLADALGLPLQRLIA